MKDMKQLLDDLQADEDLRAQLVALGEDEKAVSAALAEAGYDVTAADLQALAEAKASELSDEDLDNVAGGKTDSTIVGLSAGLSSIVGFGASCWIA